MTRAHVSAALVLLLAAQPALAADAKVYKWVDQEGNITYSSSPPPGGQAEELEVRTGSGRAGDDAPAPAAPAGEAPGAGGTEPAEQPATVTTPEGDVAELTPEQQAAQRAMDQANCRIARQNLKTLEEMPARVLEKDAEGNVSRLTDDEIAARRERALLNIDKFCQ